MMSRQVYFLLLPFSETRMLAGTVSGNMYIY